LAITASSVSSSATGFGSENRGVGATFFTVAKPSDSSMRM